MPSKWADGPDENPPKKPSSRSSAGVAARGENVTAQMLMGAQPPPRDFSRVRDSVSRHANINHSAHGPSKVERPSRPVAAKGHRRSRESPDGDSETDDSEFAAPPTHAPQGVQNLRQSGEWRRDRPSTASTSASARKESEMVRPGGVATAYNTYMNAAGSEVDHSTDVGERDTR